jgi:hypothetical protein
VSEVVWAGVGQKTVAGLGCACAVTSVQSWVIVTHGGTRFWPQRRGASVEIKESGLVGGMPCRQVERLT